MDVTTFEEDLLDLSGFAERLRTFIEVEYQFVSGSLVLALSSKFGTGKTTFLRMWRADLENDESNESGPRVITLNAWESDYYGDPLFAIVSSLIESLQDSGESADSLVNAAKDVGWFATAIGGQIAKKFTGVDAVAAGNLAEKKKAQRGGDDVSDTFSIYKGRKEAMRHLQSAISEYVADSEPRVLFLVDELDRCRPDYAISYLETIKHIFDVQGAVFILAADRQHLENSAKTAFGSDLDFEEYYRKFVHREVSLPPISDEGYGRLASAYVSHYLERDGLRNCFMELSSYRIKNIVELVAALKLTPRQIQEVFRILGHVLASSEEKKGKLLWCIGVGTIAMAAFKVGRPEVFQKLGFKEFEPADAIKFLTDLLGDSHIDWWFTLFLTGDGLQTKKGAAAKEVMADVGLIEDGQEIRNLGQWGQGWGHHSSNRFTQIREKIDQISQWN